MTPAAVSTPCVTFLIRLPDTRQTDTSHARHRANRRPGSPEDGPLGLATLFPSIPSPTSRNTAWPGYPLHLLASKPRQMIFVERLASIIWRPTTPLQRSEKRHAGTTQIPVVSPTANPPRGTPSPRHSERGHRNATAPQHPGRHPPAIHRPTVTAPPCRRNQG